MVEPFDKIYGHPIGIYCMEALGKSIDFENAWSFCLFLK